MSGMVGFKCFMCGFGAGEGLKLMKLTFAGAQKGGKDKQETVCEGCRKVCIEQMHPVSRQMLAESEEGQPGYIKPGPAQ